MIRYALIVAGINAASVLLEGSSRRMRVKITKQPTYDCIDGIQLDGFQVGLQYEVGNSLGALFLAEGWAEPVASDEPAVVIPMSEFVSDTLTGIRGLQRPAYDLERAVAADRTPRRNGD
jgi:hypothetical protein